MTDKERDTRQLLSGDLKESPLPPHENPTSLSRVATAPYNFVPLPDRIVPAAADAAQLPDHDTYAHRDYPHSGWFDVKLTTQSPLFIRGTLTAEELACREEDDNRPFRDRIKNEPEFFSWGGSAAPVIPGSSLRGMIRNVVEIAGYGKIGPICDEQLFFRHVDRSMYRNRFARRDGKIVKGGFFRRTQTGGTVTVCEVRRVSQVTVEQRLGWRKPAEDASVPDEDWNVQHMTVWVSGGDGEDKVLPRGQQRRPVASIERDRFDGSIEARLVLTGQIAGKKREFVFIRPGKDATTLTVPEGVIDLLHDESQITAFQEEAFPNNKPRPGSRRRAGWLEHKQEDLGDPVFFLADGDRVTCLGRAQLFRLPYENSPVDLVPPEQKGQLPVDFAEALFGYVRRDPTAQQGSKRNAYASRLSFTDARLVDEPVWASSEPVIPKVLASPKPTAVQHYVTQAHPDDKNRLYDYDSPPQEATIRGFKRYWQQQGRHLDSMLDPDQSPGPSDTQHTLMRPLAAGNVFTFRIHFDNLSDAELGAICWALHPLGPDGEKYCHSLGMGKLLGMGSVSVDATLHLVDRAARYTHLFGDQSWQSGEQGTGRALPDRATLEPLVRPFEEHVLRALEEPKRHLCELKRIRMLLAMMSSPGIPFPGRTVKSAEAMPLSPPKEQHRAPSFKDRRVLPDPLTVMSGDLPPPQGGQAPQVGRKHDNRPPRPPLPKPALTRQPDPAPRSTLQSTSGIARRKFRRGDSAEAIVLSAPSVDRIRLQMKDAPDQKPKLVGWNGIWPLPAPGETVRVRVSDVQGDKVIGVKPLLK